MQIGWNRFVESSAVSERSNEGQRDDDL